MIVAVGDGVRYCDPDIFVGLRWPANYPPDLHMRPIPKVYNRSCLGLQFHQRPMEAWPQTFFADDAPHSGLLALDLVRWMGAQDINLIGAERPRTTPKDGDTDYDALLERAPHYLRVFSCSPLAEINRVVPYSPLGELLDTLERSVPRSHLPDVWTCRMRPEQPHGIVTGLDKAQEFLLEWWLKNLRKHNPEVPVCVVDFGLTPGTMHRLLPFNGDLYQKYGPLGHRSVVGDVVNPWFFKPGAIAQAPFSTVLWLDPDCEVRGDLSPLLHALDDKPSVGLAAVLDPLQPDTRFNGGVLAIRRDADLVRLWCEAVRDNQGENDQEALNCVCSALGVGTVTLHRRWNWVVHDPEGRTYEGAKGVGATIIHHIGPCGKERIRRLIEAQP
jgi:hypothetical protein